jgi:hypothetical protein
MVAAGNRQSHFVRARTRLIRRDRQEVTAQSAMVAELVICMFTSTAAGLVMPG